MVGVGVGVAPSPKHAEAKPSQFYPCSGPDALEREVRRIITEMKSLVASAERVEPGVRVRLAQIAQREFAAVEAAGLAELKARGASSREVSQRAAAGGTRSRKETSKLSKRADAVGENPELATKLGEGDVGVEHVDALAEASAQSAGEAARDSSLISKLESSKPDDAHKVTARWLEGREDNAAQSRYDRQRANRKAVRRRSVGVAGASIELTGTDEAAREMWARIEARASELYEADGGRDLPDTVLERYGCQSMIAGTVFSQRGDVLWHGRTKRSATPAQLGALIARDGGCVLCGADASRCEAHHLKPFNAPIAGQTNIDELALVCASCHHWLHDDKRTLTYTRAVPPESDKRGEQRVARGSPPELLWRTRPAKPEEVAPRRRTSHLP